MARNAEDQKVVSKGSLWADFSQTAWGEDLIRFTKELTEEGKELIFKSALAGDLEKAKALALRLDGVQLILDYINGCVNARRELLDSEKDQRFFDA